MSSGEVPEEALSSDRETQPEALRVALPQTHPDHSFPNYGWTTVAAHTKLLKSYEALLEASKTFFALPEAEKAIFKTAKGSEDGWNVVEGEKEFITLRTLVSSSFPVSHCELNQTGWNAKADARRSCNIVCTVSALHWEFSCQVGDIMPAFIFRPRRSADSRRSHADVEKVGPRLRSS